MIRYEFMNIEKKNNFEMTSLPCYYVQLLYSMTFLIKKSKKNKENFREKYIGNKFLFFTNGNCLQLIKYMI